MACAAALVSTTDPACPDLQRVSRLARLRRPPTRRPDAPTCARSTPGARRTRSSPSPTIRSTSCCATARRLFPGVPVVHASVFKSYPVPAPAAGRLWSASRSNTTRGHHRAGVALASGRRGAAHRDRRLRPRPRPGKRGWRRQAPQVAERRGGRISPAGLPTGSAAASASARWCATAVVFTPGYYQDGEGRLFNPRDSAEADGRRVDRAGLRPVRHLHRHRRGRRLDAELRGHGPAGRPRSSTRCSPAPRPRRCACRRSCRRALHVDWRQVQRWGIDEAQIPADASCVSGSRRSGRPIASVAIVTAAVILLQAGADRCAAARAPPPPRGRVGGAEAAHRTRARVAAGGRRRADGVDRARDQPAARRDPDQRRCRRADARSPAPTGATTCCAS